MISLGRSNGPRLSYRRHMPLTAFSRTRESLMLVHCQEPCGIQPGDEEPSEFVFCRAT